VAPAEARSEASPERGMALRQGRSLGVACPEALTGRVGLWVPSPLGAVGRDMGFTGQHSYT
jgi:hypothetical protein